MIFDIVMDSSSLLWLEERRASGVINTRLLWNMWKACSATTPISSITVRERCLRCYWRLTIGRTAGVAQDGRVAVLKVSHLPAEPKVSLMSKAKNAIHSLVA
jgi:hypothetical protein